MNSALGGRDAGSVAGAPGAGSLAGARGAGSLAGALGLVEGTNPGSEPRLASDVRAWLASPEQSLTAGIESVAGAEAATDALARLAPSRLTVVATVHADRGCWAEIARHSDAADPETCLLGLSYGPGAEVSRLVWLRVPLVPRPEADRAVDASVDGSVDGAVGTPEAAGDGRQLLERYFGDLMNSRFREAASHFTGNTLYSHPPYAGGTERVLFEGRAALWRGFAELRGPSPVRQIITDFWQQGDRAFVEGVIEGIPNGGTFFGTAELSPAGEIARYVAFYSAVRIASVG
jgi:hypothetical protein